MEISREIDLLRAREVEQQVERALEAVELQDQAVGSGPGLRGGVRCRAH